MDTSKIIKGVVSNGRYTVTAPIIKEDYGLCLQIEGVELPSTYEVDFSNSEHNGTSVTMIGNSDGVLIPHQFIDTGKDIFAFLYHVGEDFGRTVYKFRIPNKVRPDRTNEQPTPEEQSTIDQAISALNTAVAQTAQDKANADASAQSAQGYAEQAESARDTAQTYANNAQTSANNASASASQASASATASAQSASQSAQIKADVEDLADDAQGYAQASAQSASASANSASQAQGFAQSASASATNAQGYASNAQTSANTASSKATEASGYADTASAKATESAQSASQALSYKTDAESAKTASQTAQGLAESARDSAVSAKTDAESARDDAETARDEAQQAVASISGALDDKAPIITDTASGAIASFSDGADNLPLKSLVVDINPVQDLHGQESPYPAGGGKNLWRNTANTITLEGVTWNIGTDDIVVTGTPTGYSAVSLGRMGVDASMGEITISFDAPSPINVAINYIQLYDSNNTVVLTESTGKPLTYATTINLAGYPAASSLIISLKRASKDVAINGTIRVQVEKGSTATAWSPYSNICPISGWTEVDVEQRGKNLFDKANAQYINGYFAGSVPSQIRSGNAFRTVYVPCKPNTTYRMLNKNNSGKRSVGYTTELPRAGVAVYASAFDYITTGADAKYLVCYVFNSTTDSATLEQVFDGLQIELGSTATPYEPYTGRSITISLGQTVYGGKLDVLSGVLTVTRDALVIHSASGFNISASDSNTTVFRKMNVVPRGITSESGQISNLLTFNANAYAVGRPNTFVVGSSGNLFLQFPNSTASTVEQLDTLLSATPFTVVYTLNNPITIQLTPNQVNSLLGVNNIWADSGDAEVVYRANTKLYIQKKIAEAISALS